MKTAFGFTCIALLTLIAAAQGAPAQSGCGNGIVSFTGGLNGNIKICLPVAAQAPDLAPKLNQILSAMSSQQAELDQLTRLVRNINQVSGPLDAKRQAELLTNVVTRLGDTSTVSGTQLQQRADTLSHHFEDVSTALIAAQSSPEEAVKTATALQGSLGGAIARLDFDTVENQLSDIQATVHTIDQRTQQMQGTVNDIHSDTHETAQILEQYAGQSEKAQQEMLDNPQFFVSISFSRVSGTIGGPASIQFMAMHASQGALRDAKMQFVFSVAGKQPWTVDANVPDVVEPVAASLGFDNVDVAKLGDRAEVCYSAVDSRVGQRRRWMMAYRIVSQPSPYASLYAANPVLAQLARNSPQMAASMNPLTFQSDSEATLTPDTGSPCPPPQQREDDQKSMQTEKDAQVQEQQAQDLLRQQQEKQAMEAALQAEQAEPNSFVYINLLANGIAGGPGTLIIGASRRLHQPSLTESKMQIAFSLGERQHWVIDVPISPLIDTSAISTRLDPPRVGDRAVVCFSALDPIDGQRRRWRKEYMLVGQSPTEDGRFQPASDPTLTLDTTGPCQ